MRITQVFFYFLGIGNVAANAVITQCWNNAAPIYQFQEDVIVSIFLELQKFIIQKKQ